MVGQGKFHIDNDPFGQSQSKIIAVSGNVEYISCILIECVCRKMHQQMLGGNTVPSPWWNLPSINVWCLHKIGFQMPWQRKWREGVTILELGKQFRQLFAVSIFHDDISLPYVRFCYALWVFSYSIFPYTH